MRRGDLKDRVWMQVAYDIAELHTCARRAAGCVILDEEGKLLSSGYNGPATGRPNCTDKPCAGAGCPSGTGLELCEAIHAEQNAIAQCRFPEKAHTVYVTCSPCIFCVRQLATTAAKRIVFGEEYQHPDARAYWEARGGVWELLPHQPLTGVKRWLQNAKKAVSAGFSRVFK